MGRLARALAELSAAALLAATAGSGLAAQGDVKKPPPPPPQTKTASCRPPPRGTLLGGSRMQQQSPPVRFQRGNRLANFWPGTPKASSRGALASVDLVGRVAVPPQLAMIGGLIADGRAVNDSEGVHGSFGVEADWLRLFNGSQKGQ